MRSHFIFKIFSTPNSKLLIAFGLNTVVYICERLISTTVTHSNNAFEPVTVTVIYAPASSSVRYPFFSNLVNESSGLLPLCPNRYILLGDFNYSSSTTTTAPRAPVVWRQYVSQFFVDCITDHGSVAQPTFHRGNSRSCIDYIFASCDLSSQRSCGSVTYITPAWSDHFLLTSVFHHTASVPSQGSQIAKGLWRAHPRLASDPEFCDSLAVALSETVAGFDNSMFATLKWEDLKLTTARVAKSFSRRKAFIMAKAEECLQRKRRRILKNMKKNPANIDDLQPQLKVIEEQLNSYQQFHVETLALRSGLRWRELGELSAGYLKRTVATRSAKQHVPPLIHPETQVICNTKNEMLDAASTFYSSLYSPEPVDQSAIDDLLGALPDSLKLSTTAQSLMEAPLTFDDIVEGVSRSPRRSSPGSDGLPYEILSLIVNHADCRDIVLAVYNDALCYGVFPSSWKETCVSILPKKGNLADLKNWRPISLINTDAKVYTLWLHAPPIYCRQWSSHAPGHGSCSELWVHRYWSSFRSREGV
ncbi:hypothetical protein G6F51_012703 [Rhizopus arrhizus]|uniref:Endonuclease/exonuclease/phosphatase domain-containing protein n=1 Tax=Rhizopus oryzae TaxID=64495 RepID=A0A9P6XV85_RHIOR|nr:hypothetical protein G6F51_012703 [Rhizopus arrhizus]